MKKILKFTLLAFVALMVIIQFIPVEVPENSDELSNDLLQTAVVPEEVTNILKTSCYDCHSMQTSYPWYSHVAPASWLVIKDVNEGREELNFTEWNSLSKRKQLKLLNDIAEIVESKEMPMPIYTVIHRGAILDEADISLVVNWATTTAEEMLGGNDDAIEEGEEEEGEEEEVENEEGTDQ
jgi:hypothetical protein